MAMGANDVVESREAPLGGVSMPSDWKETCAKCMEGEIEPRHCEYYGEPSGCNSPTYGEHPRTPPVGNAAAMRRTLLRFLVWAQQDLWEHAWYGQSSGNYKQLLDAMVKEISEALSAPPRQCDVGTAEEQAERMDMFCKSHKHGFDGLKCYACENCKFISVDRCELAWAQMPYEEGGRDA